MDEEIKKVDPASPSEVPSGMPPIPPSAPTPEPSSPPINMVPPPPSFTPPPTPQPNMPPIPPPPMGTPTQPSFSVPQPFMPPQPKFEPVGRAVTSSPIPSTPAPDIGIRTMASDLSSLKSSGGLEAKPKIFNPEEFTKEPVFESPRSVSGGTVKIIPTKSGPKILLISLGIIVFVAIAGAVIYFLVLPMIFSREKSPVVESPTVPVVNVQPPIETSPPLIHQSFFIAPISVSKPLPMNLANLDLAGMNSALSAVSSSIPLQTAKEVVLMVSGSVPEAASFLSVAFPEMDKNFVVSNFEKDFTAFLYRDVNGSWPGYIFRLKPGTDPGQVASALRVIETSTNIPNLYLTNPGTSNPTGFKDGLKIGGKAIRYLSFNAPGSSFDYGWFNNYLMVTTSFDGFKEALKLLGSSS